MKRMFLFQVPALVVLSALATTGRFSAAATSTDASATKNLAARIGRVENGLRPTIRVKGGPVWHLEQRMERLGVPGLAVAVIDSFEIAWIRAYGVTDVSERTPVTETTLFQAASISKPVAAAVALHFVDAGLLDLDGDVNGRLRSWKVPENEFTQAEKVTLRRILSHTAGLTVSGFRGYAEGEPKPTILQVLDGTPPANSDPIRVDVVPGSIYRYSGGGYTVLQLLLEDVTGKPLPELTRELVFEPLGMVHSSFDKPLPQALLERTSSGHTREGSPMQGHWFLDHGSTCCGLWTTPADLARFAIEIQKSLGGESNLVMSPRTAGLMVTPQPPGSAGLGMFVEEKNGNAYFSHSGGNPGFACVLVASREGGKGAAVMTNSDNGHALCGEIVRSIAAEYEWENYLIDEFATTEDLLDSLRLLKAEHPDDPRVSENGINGIGYSLLQAEEFETAVAVFALNLEFNPRSANCHDSLAEAYMMSGDRDRAVELYEKALVTIDRYPDENRRYQRLRDTIPQQLEKLKSGQ
jgi:CubicO group peptidase (beta-lactamase class C family)